jgi:heat-inducible transcriptional repressor
MVEVKRVLSEGAAVELSERQKLVLRAVVAAYVADVAPVSSATVSHLLPIALSSASIRNTMSELEAVGLIEKPHASAGRVPTELGLRCFLDQLLDPPTLAAYERRSLETSFELADHGSLMETTSQLLSERTQQLGFALTPRIEHMTLRHVSLVRVAVDKVLVVLVPQAGPSQQCVIDEPGTDDQARVDQMAAALNERAVGRTLFELRSVLEDELRELRSEARDLLSRGLSLGLRLLALVGRSAGDLVITSRSALLNQPELNDPEQIRGIFAAVETNEQLISVLARVLEGDGDVVSISLGEELAEPGLRRCAMVAIPYGGAGHFARDADEVDTRSSVTSAGALGVLGVIGPNRMDYSRIIPLVSYCSRLVTEKLNT